MIGFLILAACIIGVFFLIYKQAKQETERQDQLDATRRELRRAQQELERRKNDR